MATVAAIYAQTIGHDFVTLDDLDYVVDNPRVNTGLRAENVGWAFTHSHVANWHPLTWISHMLDCELFGLSAGGHHFHAAVLHAAAAVFLFLALRRLTGDLWPSAFVAAAFAVHPLRVESVAWAAERKDVLSGLFFALILLAYERYARAPSARRYLLVAAALALGLLAKPMLVTAPCVLLLLDYWPLRRLGPPATLPVRWVLAEKLPLLALISASAAATLLAQSRVGAVAGLDAFPLDARLGNAVISYAVYVGQSIYPADLAVYYPHPKASLPTAEVFGAAALLVVITGAAVAFRRRCPAVLVGWLWYLGMLVPVIGLVQVGSQAHADRYTYLPQIGLWVALVWGVPWGRIAPRRVVTVVALAVLLVWAVLSHLQANHWRNSEALYKHTLACTGPNPATHFWLGLALSRAGRHGEAADEFQRVYELEPAQATVRENLVTAHVTEGTRQAREGHTAEAVRHFDAALAVDPGSFPARHNKATLYIDEGLKDVRARRFRDAVAAFSAATRADPNLSVAWSNLGLALMEVGDFGIAADAFRSGLRIDSGNARLQKNLEKATSRIRP